MEVPGACGTTRATINARVSRIIAIQLAAARRSHAAARCAFGVAYAVRIAIALNAREPGAAIDVVGACDPVEAASCTDGQARVA